MTSNDPILEETEAEQARASAPDASAWVRANAGAGKTHVLMMRVLRLLLAGTEPERILCLTFTKAAAAEMSNRIFKRLASWTTASTDTLDKELGTLLGRCPTEGEVRDARQMFARAIETPGGLKVQTIHAFCERVLQRFPLEAGIPPGFQILDEEVSKTLIREAIDQTLAEATGSRATGLGSALDIAVRWAAEQRFDDVLAAALNERAWLRDMASRDTETLDAPSKEVESIYRRLLQIDENATNQSLSAEMEGVLSDEMLRTAASFLADGGKRDQDLGQQFQSVVGTSGAERVDRLARAFLTKEGKPKSHNQSYYLSKGKREEQPSLADTLDKAQSAFHAFAEQQRGLQVVEATVGLIRLASRVMQRYEDAKARRAALDYDDLIESTARLLSDSANPQWFHYKLDGGLDHILVDEAQDTSPEQWKVISALAGEFYGDGGTREQLRTLFAVGDEKQSIYSFQGAAPERFASEGDHFATAARHKHHPWHDVRLRLSFRTVSPILESVDTVFADPARTPGVTAPVEHIALRALDAGLVEVWVPEQPEEAASADPFAPLEDEAPRSPVTALANRIAETIKGWLENGEMLVSQNRPLRASDIMILVRKRQPFADAMVRALKSWRIPVAGADQLVLANQIAIQDLMALGDFLTLPEDDLALAVVLKSPLFDLGDDDLLRIAPGRKGLLWTALLAAAKDDDRLAYAAEKLKRWRAYSDFTPPFEFYAALLEQDGARTRFLERLGPDAADAIDEFMNLALAFDDQAPASMQGFLCWLREGDRKIKRDMEQTRDEVRVMTVHGAKGLEAPIVFLPDTCSAPGGGDRAPLARIELTDNPTERPLPFVWKIGPGKDLPRLQESRNAKNQREWDEHNRLLYVAMTRARDRLYVCGFQTSDKRGKHCWYDTIRDSLAGKLNQTSDAAGRTVWCTQSGQQRPAAEPRGDDTKPMVAAEAPPDWARTNAPLQPQLSIPLAPSRLAPLDTDETGEPAAFEDVRRGTDAADEGKPPSPAQIGSEHRFLRGTLTHALLEHLPHQPRDTWHHTATAFVDARGAPLRPIVRKNIVDETLAVLCNDAFADVFGPLSRAEVPIVAEIPPPSGAGIPLRLTGQIDRLWVGDHDILILDYKTNRPPPEEVENVAEAYLLQLAAYRLAMKDIFMGKSVRAAILWTDGCRLMEIPPATLEIHEARLWALRTGRLDAERSAT
jgi:ATP-dependent helicase/nuclease subunit A